MLWASNRPPQTPLHSQAAAIAALSLLEDSEKTSSHLRATQTLCDLTSVIVCVLFLAQWMVSIIIMSKSGCGYCMRTLQGEAENASCPVAC